MPYPRKQTLSAASLAANRRNARKSTGPRAPQAKARVALNGIKHGLNAPRYLKNLAASGEPMRPYFLIGKNLVDVLRPRTRLAEKRLVRFAQMIWSLYRRTRKLVPRNARMRSGTPITIAEFVLQGRVLNDLLRAQKRATPEQRKLGRKMARWIAWLGWQARGSLTKPKYANQSRNVL